MCKCNKQCTKMLVESLEKQYEHEQKMREDIANNVKPSYDVGKLISDTFRPWFK